MRPLAPREAPPPLPAPTEAAAAAVALFGASLTRAAEGGAAARGAGAPTPAPVPVPLPKALPSRMGGEDIDDIFGDGVGSDYVCEANPEQAEQARWGRLSTP